MLTPDAIIAAYRAELVRLYGAAYADATYVAYRRGWFCIGLPVQIREKGYTGEHAFSHRYHRLDLELMVARLQAREPTMTEELR